MRACVLLALAACVAAQGALVNTCTCATHAWVEEGERTAATCGWGWAVESSHLHRVCVHWRSPSASPGRPCQLFTRMCASPAASGPIQGILTSVSREFRGVPFAAPPVGTLRWAAPQAKSAWAPSVWDATAGTYARAL